MFRLTKQEAASRVDHVKTLQTKLQAVRDAEAKRIALIEEGDSLVAATVLDYSGALVDAKSFAEGVAGRLREEFDNKSERWQESDKASEVSSFIEEWENLEMEDVDESETSQPDEITADHQENLEGLAEEANA